MIGLQFSIDLTDLSLFLFLVSVWLCSPSDLTLLVSGPESESEASFLLFLEVDDGVKTTSSSLSSSITLTPTGPDLDEDDEATLILDLFARFLPILSEN